MYVCMYGAKLNKAVARICELVISPVRVYTHMCACVCAHIYACECIHMCARLYMCFICMFLHACIHTYIHTLTLQ